jgi:hypothetical protein
MIFLPKRASVIRRRLRIALPGLLVLAAACASAPPVPETSLQSAQQAIANAERVDAATHAAVELGEARSKLASAQAAVAKEDMIVGGQLADEARAEAELATALSTVAKANAVNQEMKRSTATLEEEMQRKTGSSQ